MWSELTWEFILHAIYSALPFLLTQTCGESHCRPYLLNSQIAEPDIGYLAVWQLHSLQMTSKAASRKLYNTHHLRYSLFIGVHTRMNHMNYNSIGSKVFISESSFTNPINAILKCVVVTGQYINSGKRTIRYN